MRAAFAYLRRAFLNDADHTSFMETCTRFVDTFSAIAIVLPFTSGSITSHFHMPFDDPSWEDAQRDRDPFPAYSDYLYGPDRRVLRVAQEPGLHPQLYPRQWFEPVRYTSALPSRSLLYRSVQGRPQEADRSSINHMDEIALFTAEDGSPLDLRWPQSHHPEMANLLPPESVRPMPLPVQHPRALLSMPLNPARQALPAEATGHKRLNASQPQSLVIAPSSSPYRFREPLAQQTESRREKEQRRNPRRQATNSVRYRSSSPTDVDSQVGEMPPSNRAGHTPATSPTSSAAHAGVPLSQPQRLPRYHMRGAPQSQPTHVSQPAAGSPPHIPLIRPGELLSNPRYAVAPRDNLERMNDQITRLYMEAQHGDDFEARMLAMGQIRKNSTNIHCMMRDWEARTMQMAVDLPEQLGLSMQTEQQGPQGPQVFNEPIQPEVYHHPDQPQAFQQPAPIYQHRETQPQSQYAQPQYHEPLRYHEPQRHEPQNHGPQHQEPHEQNPQTHEPQQYELPQHHEPQHQPQEFMAPSQPPHQPPVTAVHIPKTPTRPEMRKYVQKHLPNFIAAMRLTTIHIDPNTTDPKQLEDLAKVPVARDWIARFKASLGPEGQEYMLEVVTRMEEARREGRDWVAEIGKD